MSKINKVQFGVLITVFMTAALSAMPLQAAIRQQSQPLLTGKNGSYLALSWGDIWNRIRRTRNPGGGRGESFCPIAPVKLVDSDSPNLTQTVVVEVWSDRPLFLWKGGGVKQFELLLPGSEKPWTPKLSQGETKVIYDGKPLQPGQSYEWRVTTPFPISRQFRVMEREKRDRITKELTALEEQLKKQRASAETIALEKANYFADRGLWPDALRELYLVPKPSAELIRTIEQIQAHDFCPKPKNEPNVPTSR
jgi:hypothetical protein